MMTSEAAVELRVEWRGMAGGKKEGSVDGGRGTLGVEASNLLSRQHAVVGSKCNPEEIIDGKVE